MKMIDCVANRILELCRERNLAVNALALVMNVRKYLRMGGGSHAQGMLAILEAARRFECEAEQMTGYSGAEKLQYVLSRLRVFTADMGYPYDEEALRAAVESDIAFSKEVNADKSERLE